MRILEDLMDYVVPMTVNMPKAGEPGVCLDCHGLGVRYSFEVKSNVLSAPSQKGDKYLEIDGFKPGWYHGELHAEPCPTCKSHAMISYLLNRSGLEPEDREIRLTDFKTNGIYQDKKDAYNVIARLAGQGNNANGFITLWGNYGVGKSMLAKALVCELIRNEVPARYVIGSDLVSDIRVKFDEMSNRMVAVEQAIFQWQTKKVLVIDEFDKINSARDWVKESLHRLLDARYNKRQEYLTVLISNTDPKKLPTELGYLQSRMFAGVIILVPGIDVRPGQGEIEKRKLMA